MHPLQPYRILWTDWKDVGLLHVISALTNGFYSITKKKKKKNSFDMHLFKFWQIPRKVFMWIMPWKLCIWYVRNTLCLYSNKSSFVKSLWRHWFSSAFSRLSTKSSNADSYDTTDAYATGINQILIQNLNYVSIVNHTCRLPPSITNPHRSVSVMSSKTYSWGYISTYHILLSLRFTINKH